MITTWQQHWQQQITERQQQHLLRNVQMFDDKPYRAFISNDYLGLANHPTLKKALVDGAEKYGVGSGASHLLGGHSRAHQQLEEELAAFTGRERALLFSTGYMANLGVLTALLNKGDYILQDKFNHASLIDGGLSSGADFRRYLHADVISLEKHLLRTTGKKTFGLQKTLVATDGVFSMDGDIAPLPALTTLCNQHDALLMVDDAHGLGVLGKTGAGSCEHFSLVQKDVPVLMGTFGKALGSFGAFVAGSHTMIEILIQFARTFVYTTAIPPAQAAVTSTALHLLNTESWRREKLQSNIGFFRQQAQQRALPLMDSPTAIQPLLIGSSEQVMNVDEKLRARGFLVGAVRPPTVAEGAARLRITLSAMHEEKILHSYWMRLQKSCKRPYEDNCVNNHPLILLHGWGFSSQLWQPLIKALHAQGYDSVYPIDLPGFGTAFHEPCASLEQVLDCIVEQLPEKSVLCGWSLGGMLAVQIAARHPEKIAAIITVGSNLHFTNTNANKNGNWPGMPAEDYQQFCQRFSNQPEKTWQRFLVLQTRGDNDAVRAAATLELIADYSVIERDTAEKMLALLGEIDNRRVFATLTIPGLHVLAENDAITPAAIAPLLEAENSIQQVKILSGSGHAMPISRTAQLTDLITDFLTLKQSSASKNTVEKLTIEKSRIADSFSRAANSYDNAAQLQRNIGSALSATLPEQMSGVVVDIGCGTGFITRELLKKYGDTTNVIGLDFAAGMLQRTHQNNAGVLCVQADMEKLPFADCTADWLISNLALQWANNPLQCFQEWRRILKPHGSLFFATFLPGTLRELEQSWRAVDDAVHVNQFVAHETLLDTLHAAGFTQVEIVPATHKIYYPDANALARELKAIGAHNMNEGQPTGLTGKQRWKKLQAAYEPLRTERGLPASYEVLYVSAS